MEQQGLDHGTAEEHQEAILFSSNEHGHLVQQILNSQKELSQTSGKTEIVSTYSASPKYRIFRDAHKILVLLVM